MWTADGPGSAKRPATARDAATVRATTNGPHAGISKCEAHNRMSFPDISSQDVYTLFVPNKRTIINIPFFFLIKHISHTFDVISHYQVAISHTFSKLATSSNLACVIY